jgi:hypothetical protein
MLRLPEIQALLVEEALRCPSALPCLGHGGHIQAMIPLSLQDFYITLLRIIDFK